MFYHDWLVELIVSKDAHKTAACPVAPSAPEHVEPILTISKQQIPENHGTSVEADDPASIPEKVLCVVLVRVCDSCCPLISYKEES